MSTSSEGGTGGPVRATPRADTLLLMRTPTTVRGSYLWRSLDHLGLDGCRLLEVDAGWRVTGTAVFSHGPRLCHLLYDVSVDRRWRTRQADVSGYVGERAIDISIRSPRAGHWHVNGVDRVGLADCLDLDLGFTPATNQIAIRRLRLRIGQRAQAPAAYLRFPDMRLTRLPQIYVRAALREYDYEAPSFGYRARLRVDTAGAIVRYPGLFERVTPGRARR